VTDRDEAVISSLPDRTLPPAAYVRMTLILRAGLLLSLTILAVTLAVYVAVHPAATSASVIGSNPILRYLSVTGLVVGLARGSLEAYLTLGLLVLLVTPVLRVASGFYYFEKGHDRGLARITLAVLLLLLFGLLVLGPLLR
jgi:uncharacterized membrane protein